VKENQRYLVRPDHFLMSASQLVMPYQVRSSGSFVPTLSNHTTMMSRLLQVFVFCSASPQLQLYDVLVIQLCRYMYVYRYILTFSLANTMKKLQLISQSP
jgi:hypothetical protein